ncbi:beta-N-acetylhexosaminidase [Ammoniphilus sp. 3BR4]|uniref:beta-N-acetylhexosaminidase n=1 Tax=Ammoniphilus sp. 3BR4 TaxID=3158265 RepID=UPI00346662F5
MLKKKSSGLQWFLLFALFVAQVSAGREASGEGPLFSDLIIDQNIPQAELQLEANQVQLSALHRHGGGHFTKAGEGVQWTSSNPAVSEVTSDGRVTFHGQKGKTVIRVTDGLYTDRITLKWDPPENVVAIKEDDERYEVVSYAIQTMTLEEKIGQMLMPDFREYHEESVTAMLPDIEALVKKYHIGGVILFRENVVTTAQTAQLIRDFQKASEKFGLLVSIDQEGGIVTRLQSETQFPGNMALGATRDPELSFRAGKAIGEELKALGINMNFAPVMDINNNPDNPVIGVRSFSENPQMVAELGTAYIRGMQSAGVAATAKHFPGHGDTTVDSHLGLAEVPHSKERLFQMELLPFQEAMKQNIDAIMTAHVTFPNIDPSKAVSELDGSEIAVPATLSPIVLTGLMREQMGYEGVISTDAMDMKAIADHFGPVDAAVRAVKAGADIILMPVGLEDVAEGLYEAVRTGEIREERINESVKRIMALKVKRGIFKEEAPTWIGTQIQQAIHVIGSLEHKALESEIAVRSITLVKNDGVLPLKPKAEQKIVVVGSAAVDDLFQAVQSHHPNTQLVKVKSSGFMEFQPSREEWSELKSADLLILGTYTFNVEGRQPTHAQMKLVKELAQTVKGPIIAVGLRNPYDIMAFPDEVDAYLVQYGFRPVSSKATADVIFGEKEPSGQLPVTIPGFDGGVLYPYGHGLTYEE